MKLLIALLFTAPLWAQPAMTWNSSAMTWNGATMLWGATVLHTAAARDNSQVADAAAGAHAAIVGSRESAPASDAPVGMKAAITATSEATVTADLAGGSATHLAASAERSLLSDAGIGARVALAVASERFSAFDIAAGMRSAIAAVGESVAVLDAAAGVKYPAAGVFMTWASVGMTWNGIAMLWGATTGHTAQVSDAMAVLDSGSGRKSAFAPTAEYTPLSDAGAGMRAALAVAAESLSALDVVAGMRAGLAAARESLAVLDAAVGAQASSGIDMTWNAVTMAWGGAPMTWGSAPPIQAATAREFLSVLDLPTWTGHFAVTRTASELVSEYEKPLQLAAGITIAENSPGYGVPVFGLASGVRSTPFTAAVSEALALAESAVLVAGRVALTSELSLIYEKPLQLAMASNSHDGIPTFDLAAGVKSTSSYAASALETLSVFERLPVQLAAGLFYTENFTGYGSLVSDMALGVKLTGTHYTAAVSDFLAVLDSRVTSAAHVAIPVDISLALDAPLGVGSHFSLARDVSLLSDLAAGAKNTQNLSSLVMEVLSPRDVAGRLAAHVGAGMESVGLLDVPSRLAAHFSSAMDAIDLFDAALNAIHRFGTIHRGVIIGQ